MPPGQQHHGPSGRAAGEIRQPCRGASGRVQCRYHGPPTNGYACRAGSPCCWDWVRCPPPLPVPIRGRGSPTPASHRSPQGHQARLGELLIRTEGGRIYLSEGGREFHELQLADTTHARMLKQLLENNGAEEAAGMRLTPMLLAGDGGSGFHWAPADKTGRSAKPGAAHGLGTPPKRPPPPARPHLNRLRPRAARRSGTLRKRGKRREPSGVFGPRGTRGPVIAG